MINKTYRMRGQRKGRARLGFVGLPLLLAVTLTGCSHEYYPVRNLTAPDPVSTTVPALKEGLYYQVQVTPQMVGGAPRCDPEGPLSLTEDETMLVLAASVRNEVTSGAGGGAAPTVGEDATVRFPSGMIPILLMRSANNKGATCVHNLSVTAVSPWLPYDQGSIMVDVSSVSLSKGAVNPENWIKAGETLAKAFTAGATEVAVGTAAGTLRAVGQTLNTLYQQGNSQDIQMATYRLEADKIRSGETGRRIFIDRCKGRCAEENRTGFMAVDVQVMLRSSLLVNSGVALPDYKGLVDDQRILAQPLLARKVSEGVDVGREYYRKTEPTLVTQFSQAKTSQQLQAACREAKKVMGERLALNRYDRLAHLYALMQENRYFNVHQPMTYVDDCIDEGDRSLAEALKLTRKAESELMACEPEAECSRPRCRIASECTEQLLTDIAGKTPIPSLARWFDSTVTVRNNVGDLEGRLTDAEAVKPTDLAGELKALPYTIRLCHSSSARDQGMGYLRTEGLPPDFIRIDLSYVQRGKGPVVSVLEVTTPSEETVKQLNIRLTGTSKDCPR